MRRGFVERLRAVEVGPLSRRYFVSNGFDGALTCVGLVVGALLSGVTEGVTVLRVGLGAAVGLGTSGVWSVWEIERAEGRARLRRVERAMLTDLDGSELDRTNRAARIVTALASGTGPVVGALVPVSPFLFEGTLLSMAEATVAAVAVACALLFAFGSYVARVAGLNPYVAGARMGLAGLVVAVVNYLLP